MEHLRKLSDSVEKLTRFIIVITFSVMIIACYCRSTPAM
jgi:hypothetical protein